MSFILNHYVPRFYLKEFCFDGAGLFRFNLDRPEAGGQRRNIEKIGSTRNLYDDDLETFLRPIESEQANMIKKINNENQIPDQNNRKILLQFITLQFLRIQGNLDNLSKKAQLIIQNFNSFFTEDEIKQFYEKTPYQIFKSMAHKTLTHYWQGIQDLSITLVINKTDIDFILSDHPIVFKNLKNNDYRNNTKGLQSPGLVIFLPTNTKIMVILYDSNHYNLKRKGNIKISKDNDINDLNLLQFYNCYTYVFYAKEEDFSYVRELYQEHIKNIDLTRKKLIKGIDNYFHKPDSNFIPDLSFLNPTKSKATGSIRNKSLNDKITTYR